VADEAVNRLGAMLEELGARFELVVEAVSGFGGRLDALRDEIFGQFAEVGGQIRFLSEQIAENRKSIIVTREDLGAEIIRVGEALGKARVEFREELSNSAKLLRTETHDQLSASAKELSSELHAQLDSSAKELRNELQAQLKNSTKELRDEIGSSANLLRDEMNSSSEQLRNEMRNSAKDLRAEVNKTASELRAELKQTNKSLANLVRKFDRFDDRITVQTKDQDQRLKKLEKKRAS
jgi:DNA anti-recombination protein RmuC